jgi:hypothetical protein
LISMQMFLEGLLAHGYHSFHMWDE